MRCCKLERKGRFVVAEPYFQPGNPITVANSRRYLNDIGKLVLVSGARSVGRIVEILGEETSITAVMRGLLAESGALGPPPHAADELVGALPHSVSGQLETFDESIPLYDERLDLRSQLCVTIDPPDARDHDDAIALLNNDDGTQTLWVHIADVSAYVPLDSPLDEYARSRAMSQYVPGMVAPMLPALLSTDLCSLRPGVDRGCVSVCMDFDETGDQVRVKFERTVIRSARKLTYHQVDAVLDGTEDIDPVIDELIRRMDEFTSRRYEQRVKRGALDLNLPDVQISIHDDRPSIASLDGPSPSHRMVEECMLLANEAVGHRLATAKAPAIYRIHQHPETTSVTALLKTLAALAVPTPPTPDPFDSAQQAQKVVAAAVPIVQRYSKQSNRGRFAFPSIVLRALQQATYSARTGIHSGLAAVNYLHFTSPIRRYPDLVNHRSLLTLLGKTSIQHEQWTLPDIAAHVSDVERDASSTERRADDIALARLLPLYDEETEYDGEVHGVIGSGAFIRFGEVFRGFLPARSLASGERHFLDERGLALVGDDSGERIQLGDPIRVRVQRVDRSNGRVDLLRVNRKST